MRTFTPRQISVTAVILLVLVVYPLVVHGSFPLHVMIMAFLFGMMGVAWNIIGGFAGMFSFGQVAFFGIGAYTSSYLLTSDHVSPWIGLFGTISFAIVALGGFGSIEGAFIAGILIGFVQTLGGYFFDPAYKYAIVFLVYLITVWIRPQGLLGW